MLAFCRLLYDTDNINNEVLLTLLKTSAYNLLIHGSEQLSISTGLIVKDLVSHCGVSWEKLPLVITNILVMVLTTYMKILHHLLLTALILMQYLLVDGV